MNYIGSKYSLLDHIERVLDDNRIPASGPALDLFAGTGAVAQFLKRRGHVVYANDWQQYAYLTNPAFIACTHLPRFETLLADAARGPRLRACQPAPDIGTYSIAGRASLPPAEPAATVLTYLDHLPGQPGPFFETYCEGGNAGRLYYNRANGLRIQAIRDCIADWHAAHLLTESERAYLIACLLEAADRVANTASVYGAYLKHIKRSAQKPLQLVALQPIPSPHGGHRVFCEDGLGLLARLDPVQLLYLDPPYNHRQYNANYHILETIACWDLADFTPRGVTGLRPASAQRSDFCRRSRVAGAFRRLFELARAEYILLSYNNEGLLPEADLLALFDEFCTGVQFERVRYSRFRADVDHANRAYKANHTDEFLVLGRLKPFDTAPPPAG